MDFVAHHSPNEDWTASHERYRPFVHFHRTQAQALAVLEKSGPEAAIEEINKGLDEMRRIFVAAEAEEQFEADEARQPARRAERIAPQRVSSRADSRRAIGRSRRR